MVNVLVDTSAWIRFVTRKGGNDVLRAVLDDGAAIVHPWVEGELALGGLLRNAGFRHIFANLPRIDVTTHDAQLAFIRTHTLAGQGVGWVDTQLLFAAMMHKMKIWTFDRDLADASERLDLLWR